MASGRFKNSSSSTSIRFQDLEIELKCLVTKITASKSARHAGELLKDCQALIQTIEKLNKTLKKVIIDTNSLDHACLVVCKKAMAQVEASEKDIHHWSVRLGFAEEKVKRGVKQKEKASEISVLYFQKAYGHIPRPLVLIAICCFPPLICFLISTLGRLRPPKFQCFEGGESPPCLQACPLQPQNVLNSSAPTAFTPPNPK